MAATRDRRSFSPKRRRERARRQESDISSAGVSAAQREWATQARSWTAAPLRESRRAHRQRECFRSMNCLTVTSCIGLPRRLRQMQTQGQAARGPEDGGRLEQNLEACLRAASPILFEEAETLLLPAPRHSLAKLCG